VAHRCEQNLTTRVCITDLGEDLGRFVDRKMALVHDSHEHVSNGFLLALRLEQTLHSLPRSIVTTGVSVLDDLGFDPLQICGG
jgi:hypothetical protein